MPVAEPAMSLESLLPEKSFLASRTTMDVMGRVFEGPHRLDTVTGNTLALCGDMPSICSSRVATPAILEFFAMAGLGTGTGILTYENLDEANELAAGLIQEGWRLVYSYPPPERLQSSEGLLVPVSLYSWLNDKSNIDSLVDEEFLPPHVFLGLEDLQGIETVLPGKAVFVKGCLDRVTGGGCDVFHCEATGNRWSILEWASKRPDGFSGFRVEEALEVETSWCVNVAVGEEDSRCLGAAVQLFSGPARQEGSRTDHGNPLPETARSVALSVAEKARALGYRGIAGFDMGVTPEGGIFVFDLNFRFVSSTPMVLLQGFAEKRTGCRITESWDKTVRGPLKPALDRLGHFAECGDFLPYRLYEGTATSEWKSIVTGMVTGGSLPEIRVKRAAMEAELGDLVEDE